MGKDYLKLEYGLYSLLQCDACSFEKKKPKKSALKSFHADGWRVINKEILCPVCAGVQESLSQTMQDLKEVKAQFESFKSELAHA